MDSINLVTPKTDLLDKLEGNIIIPPFLRHVVVCMPNYNRHAVLNYGILT